jgi:hypothetical protein
MATMTDAPRTKAGRALLANLEARFANLPWDLVSYDLTREEVLTIEHEAVADLRAAAATGLDVERLAQALSDAGLGHPSTREWAETVAAEYARLSAARHTNHA